MSLPRLSTIASMHFSFILSSYNNVSYILITESQKTWPQGYKTFCMLNSVEHEILPAHRYKKYQEIRLFVGTSKPRMLFVPLINVKMPTTVGILTFMSRKLSCSVELSMKSFITLGPGLKCTSEICFLKAFL